MTSKVLPLPTEENGEQSQSTTSENANQKDNSPSYIREEIENTPFIAIYLENEGWFLTMGKFRITEPTDSLAKLKKIVKDKPWDLLTQVMGIYGETVFNELIKNHK